jgi:methyl-accepting chemotaxis protein WspA
MELNLTIKKMLTWLVAVGAIVIGILAMASFISNDKLIETQDRLTGIVLPLETANQKIRMAIAALIERQGKIMGTSSLEELEILAERNQLETDFKTSLDQLAQLSSGRPDAEKVIGRLMEIYEAFLQKDTEILNAVRVRLKLGNSIDHKIGVMDAMGGELQKNAEVIFSRVNFAAMREKATLRQYIDSETRTEEFQAAVREMLQGDLTKSQKACNDLRLGISDLSGYGRQVLLIKDQESIQSIREEKIAQAAKLVNDSLGDLKKGLAESSDMMAILLKIEQNVGELNSTLTEVAGLRSQWLSEQGKMVDLQISMKERTSSVDTSLNALQALAQEIRNAEEEKALRVKNYTVAGILITSILAIISMIAFGSMIRRRIIAPIEQAVAFADTISKGDLTARIQLEQKGLFGTSEEGEKDEIGKLVSKLSTMVLNLNSLIGQVQQSGIQVNSSATQLAATSKQQEAIVAKQVDSTNYVVQSVGEISDVSAKLVATMQQVASMSEETAEFASSGQTDLARMKEAIQRMELASESISGKLEAINDKASNITSVVTTITKVADQTNLLSLNAAIEAEKAGEYGRGFTVVAREIRRLADQTAVATLDIDQMVQDMQSAVSAGVMEMDAFIKEVRHSAEDVARISVQLTRIIEQVQALSPSFENVNQSMQFQSDRARQINTAMMNLGEEMRQTMESLKESFLAIEQLNDAAKVLQDEVSRFKVI